MLYCNTKVGLRRALLVRYTIDFSAYDCMSAGQIMRQLRSDIIDRREISELGTLGMLISCDYLTSSPEQP